MATSKRSDVVRARRYKRMQSATHSKTKRRRKTDRTIPPMVSRDGRMYAPQPARKPKKPRRRARLPLDSTGAEVRLPAMPSLSVGWRLLSGIMTAAMSWAIFAFWSSPEFEVQSVELLGLQSVSQAEVFAQLQIVGEPVFMIDPQAMSEMILSKFSALEDVLVEVSYPAEVTITVTERQPVVAWEQAGIASWWIDSNGMAFEPLGPHEGLVVVHALAAPPSLPVIIEEEKEEQEDVQKVPTVYEIKQMLTPEMVEAILYLAEHAPENSKMIYDGRHGLGWADLDKNWNVYFGKTLDHLPVRLAIYQTIVGDLATKRWSPLFISVEYLRSPYYRITPEE